MTDIAGRSLKHFQCSVLCEVEPLYPAVILESHFQTAGDSEASAITADNRDVPVRHAPREHDVRFLGSTAIQSFDPNITNSALNDEYGKTGIPARENLCAARHFKGLSSKTAVVNIRSQPQLSGGIQQFLQIDTFLQER